MAKIVIIYLWGQPIPPQMSGATHPSTLLSMTNSISHNDTLISAISIAIKVHLYNLLAIHVFITENRRALTVISHSGM
jgi:hypothetical protein